MKKQENQGFTIIEVVLVLAIAGLIFLMVFIALPQMRRSQRDSERKDDIMSFVETVKKFQTNNRGVLPSGDTAVTYRPSDEDRQMHSDTSWAAFYHDYLDERFMDPDGEPYQLHPQVCEDNEDKNGQCDYEVPAEVDYTLYIFTQAECNEDHADPSSNPRDFAIIYRTESSGVFCYNS